MRIYRSRSVAALRAVILVTGYTTGPMSKPMSPEQALQIAEAQRHRFNELVDVFDTPQPPEVMARLEEIVVSACLSPGEVVLDVGAGAGVLIPLIENYRPSAVLACDLAEKMLERVIQKHPTVRTLRGDIALLSLPSGSVDVIFMNAVYGNIADKPRACQGKSRAMYPAGSGVANQELCGNPNQTSNAPVLHPCKPS